MRRANEVVMCLLVLTVAGAAQGVIVGNGPLDRLVEHADAIVKARVTHIGEPPFEMITFEANVIATLKSDGLAIPDRLDIEAPFPTWPTDLGLSYTENQVVLLMLQRRDGEISLVNHLRAILPATDSAISPPANDSPMGRVFAEVTACLPCMADDSTKGIALVLLSLLGSADDEDVFLPYVESEDQWLARGAQAALLRIEPTPERVKLAVDDFSAHLLAEPEADQQDYRFWEMYQDVAWSSRCGAFGMDETLVTRARTYLPIYRVLLDKAPAGYQCVSTAIEALKDVGTREDVSRLYEYVDDEKASVRHEVLEGIGRILGLEVKHPYILSYMMPLPARVEQWEKETRSTIEEAMTKENLL